MCSKECVGCSWSWRHRFSHLPFPALQDCCKIDLCRFWTIHKDLLLLLIYIIPLNIFLSCCRSVKCTLAKDKEEIPSLKSFRHRRQTVISSAEKKNPSQRRKGRAAWGNCQLKSVQEGRLVCSSPERQMWYSVLVVLLLLWVRTGRWQPGISSKPCSFRHMRLSNCCACEMATAMKRASLLALPSSRLWEPITGGKLLAPTSSHFPQGLGRHRRSPYSTLCTQHPFISLLAPRSHFLLFPLSHFHTLLCSLRTVPPGGGSGMQCSHDRD